MHLIKFEHVNQNENLVIEKSYLSDKLTIALSKTHFRLDYFDLNILYDLQAGFTEMNFTAHQLHKKTKFLYASEVRLFWLFASRFLCFF